MGHNHSFCYTFLINEIQWPNPFLSFSVLTFQNRGLLQCIRACAFFHINPLVTYYTALCSTHSGKSVDATLGALLHTKHTITTRECQEKNAQLMLRLSSSLILF
uniref:Uncharacterized protein n=1 Tax=Lutzomyia longipalpis TaxID=7200 RepID=A0A7G3B4Y7_LUTLO